jgi:hypothetical protein
MTFEPIRIGNTVVRRTKSSTSTSSSSSSAVYEIKNETSPHLMRSISAIVPSPTAIKATNVMTLRDYMKKTRHATELYVALGLVKDIGKQMQALIASGWSIACMGVNDVLVITHRDHDNFTHDSIHDAESTLGDARMDPQFLFLNDHLMFEVDADGTLFIDHALPKRSKPKEAFLSPELQRLLQGGNVAMPLQVHFKTVYYSAAQLFIYFLLNVDHVPDDEDRAYLNPIKCTKLYWFLLRCLNPVPADRKYMYI